MKKALRIIIPILLIIAVIGCTAWYLFVYDRDFTKDFLLQQARNLEDNGNHQVSAWLYEVAYQHSSKEPEVAIELAEQYVKGNNYTKAEYTLTKAISETGSVSLYAKLSAIYVEQDKLLDAVTMLGSISDPAVKAELDAMRPATPTLSPEPGLYNQYISVSVQAESGKVYMGIHGEYPTLAAPYSGPFTLEAGETKIYALSVGENGLVSDLAIGGYTVGGVVELVDFKDDAIETAVRNMFIVGSSTPIYTNELWTVESFSVPEEATTCEDLKHFTHLRTLQIPYSTTTNLSFLADITTLEELVITGSNIDGDELAAIGKLTGLKKLTLSNCGITSIAALAPLKELTYLDLSGNTIRNITPLAGMSKLSNLSLKSNAVADLTPVANLQMLTILNLEQNSVIALDPLASISSLNEFYVSHNQITSLDTISYHKDLLILEAANNAITEVAPISACTKLTRLDLSNNALTEIQSLATLKKLTYLNLGSNSIEELPAFAEDCKLVYLDASHNQISSLENLSVLKYLNELQVDYNKDIKTLEPLDDCPLLVLVNAYGTSVKDVAFLTEKSIIVNFDPTT